VARLARVGRHEFAAFPSWFLRIECDRCGKMRMIAETHMPAPDAMMLGDILHRMRHDGCGGRSATARQTFAAALPVR
jgi:hypothetical protein